MLIKIVTKEEKRHKIEFSNVMFVMSENIFLMIANISGHKLLVIPDQVRL